MGPTGLPRNIPREDRQRLVDPLMGKIREMDLVKFVALIRISSIARLRAAIHEIVSNVFDP